MSDKDRVDRLDEAVIAEILNLDKAELAELVGEADIEAARLSLQRAKAIVGKLKLARAKSEVVLHRAGTKHGQSGREAQGSRLAILRRQDPALDKKMTLAARSGKANVEADAVSMEEDLGELDAWEAEDRGGS